MKNIRYNIVLLLAALMWSCGQDVVYELPDGDKFDHLYLLQAVDQPRTAKIFMLEDEEQITNYSAFWSGLNAPRDINITFEIDGALVEEYNEANQTNFKMMPEGSYEIETTQAVIPAGKTRTKLMELKLKSYGYITAFEEYLLPLVMKTDDVKVNEDLNVIYFQISASYEPGKVPRKEVSPNMINYNFLSFNDKCLLALNPSGDVLRYGWDDEEEVFEAPFTVQTGWSSIVTISQGGVNTLQGLTSGGSVVTYQLNADATTVPAYASYSGTIFSGLGSSYKPVGNGKHGGLMMIQQSNGALNYYGLNATWTGYAGPQVITSYDFRNYKTLFFYDQDLIGITASGDMWLHKFSTDNRFSTSATKVGSGWEDYTHVTAFGTDVIARDADGKLWLYEFDLRGFWALKPLS